MECHVAFVYIAVLIRFSLGETDLPAKPYGSPFNIPCQTSGEDIDHWTLNGNTITGATNGIDSSSIMSPTLHVEFMTLSLEGQYQCFGVNSGLLLSTINVFVIGRALYPIDDCQISIGTCTNNVTYSSQSNQIRLNANIRFDNIGSKNSTAVVTDTVWTLIFPNGTSNRLGCTTNNTCQYVFSGFTIDVSISSDRLDDSAIIYIGLADYNFTITHTFDTEGVGSVSMSKTFNLHYIRNPVPSSTQPTSTPTSTTSMSSTETVSSSSATVPSDTMTTGNPSTGMTASPTTTVGSNTSDDENDDGTIAIVLGVVVGVIVVIVIVVIILLVICCYQRKRQDVYDPKNNSNTKRPAFLHMLTSPSQENRGLMDTTTTAVTPSSRQLDGGQQTPMYDTPPMRNGSMANAQVNAVHHPNDTQDNAVESAFDNSESAYVNSEANDDETWSVPGIDKSESFLKV